MRFFLESDYFGCSSTNGNAVVKLNEAALGPHGKLLSLKPLIYGTFVLAVRERKEQCLHFTKRSVLS